MKAPKYVVTTYDQADDHAVVSCFNTDEEVSDFLVEKCEDVGLDPTEIHPSQMIGRLRDEGLAVVIAKVEYEVAAS